MKHKIILVIAISLAPYLAFARLGDTPESLVSRMGVTGFDITNATNSPLANTRVMNFQKNGISLVVTFWNGKSCEESYKKLDGGEFSDTEIQAMLQQNSLGGVWWDTTAGGAIKNWTWGTKDGLSAPPVMQAVYAYGNLGMYSMKYRIAEDAAKAAANSAADRKRVQGF